MYTCPNCSQPIEDAGRGTCPHCGADIEAGNIGGVESTTPPPDGSSVPFEDRSLPFFKRFFETVKLAFSNPKDLFSNMQADDIGPPVLYAVIIGTITFILSISLHLMFGTMASMVERTGFEEFFLRTGFMMIIMLFSPLFVLVGLFIHAGVFHLMLLLVGDGNRGFSITLRTIAYGQTPGLLGIVPVCGGIIGSIWSIVLVIIGTIHGHKTDGWRATLAYLLPLILCCCGVIGLAMMFGFIGRIN